MATGTHKFIKVLADLHPDRRPPSDLLARPPYLVSLSIVSVCLLFGVSAAWALTAKRKPTSWGIMSARARRLIPLHQRLHKLLLPRVQPKAAEGFTRAFIAARVKIELTCKGMLRLQPTP